MSSEVDVVIVGAGAAGLSAAIEARRRGLTHTVIEASHRIGGRAYAEEIAPGINFDLGCSYLHQGDINPFGPIADALGFTVGRQFGDIFEPGGPKIWRNGKRLTKTDEDAYWAYAGRCREAIEQAAAEGRDVAITEVIDLESPDAPIYLSNMATLFAGDPDMVSVIDPAEFADGPDWPIREGFATLVAGWGGDVPVTLDAQARRIEWGGGGVAVETPKGTINGRSALITVSTGVLGAGDIAFHPGLPDWKAEAIAALPTGCMNKVAVHFDRDVFGPEGRGFCYTENGTDPPAGFEVSPFGDPVAVVFIGGRFAEWLERQGQDAGRDYAVSHIAEAFGGDIRNHVTRVIVTAWADDPWTRGSYSSALPGQGHRRKELARDIDHRLFFAGEATIDKHMATCHGAYLSGIRAAGEIAAALAEFRRQAT